jgi:hypothetical protein
LQRSISEYLLRIKAIVDSLIAISDTVSDQEHVNPIPEGLPEEFNAFVMMVYSRLDTPTVEDIEALLMVQEAQFEKFQQELNNPSVSANLAQSEAKTDAESSNHENTEVGTEHYAA